MNKPPTSGEIRIAVALTAVFLFLIVLVAARYSGPEEADFGVPYTGGLILHQGNASKLYDLYEQERVQVEIVKRKGLLPDVYPPFHALLFAPLTWLGYRAAYVTWGAINILLWVLFQHVLRNQPGVTIHPFRYLMLCALFFPLLVALVQGQVSFTLLVSFTLAFMYLRRRQEYAAGFALGLGLLKFPAVLPFVLIFALRRKWRVIAGFGAVAALLGLVSVIAVGPSGVLSYANLMIDNVKHPSNPAWVAFKPWNMPTIRGFVTGLLRGEVPQHWITALSVVLSGCLIVLTAWCWELEDKRGERDSFDLMFAAALVVSLLTAPYLQPHDLTPMLLAVILAITSPRWAARSRERLMLRLTISILYAAPLYYLALLRREELYLFAPVLVVFALSALVLGRKSACKVTADSELKQPHETPAYVTRASVTG